MSLSRSLGDIEKKIIKLQRSNEFLKKVSCRVDEDLLKRTEMLEEENDSLHLLTQTLIQILIKKNVINLDEFDELLMEIDDQDGELDGKITKVRDVE